jgi:hypothetical protein
MRRGVTALELMIATALLAMGLVPLLSLQMDSTRQAGFTQGHALAVAHAGALLDRAAAMGWRKLAAGAAGGLGPDARGTSRERERAPAAVRRRRLLVPDPGPAPGGFEVVKANVAFTEVSPGLGELTADLSWRMGPRGAEHRVRTGRLLARPEASWLVGPPPPARTTLPGE